MNHLTHDDLVSYFAGDHPGEASVEEHLFGCEACTLLGERVSQITEALRSSIPPVIDRRRLEALRARGLRIREQAFPPGITATVVFTPDLDLLIHRLSGLDLSSATRVGVRVLSIGSGQVLVEVPEAKFEPGEGALFIACQRHYGSMPADVRFEVRVESPRGEQVERYDLIHEFQR